MTSLWDVNGNNLDIGFTNIREAQYRTERNLRDALDALWACYEPYADPDFREGFARDPHSRFWEMYIGYRLLRADKTLRPTVERQNEGGQPDICVLEGDRKIWIEAIAPQCGVLGPDQVRGPRPLNEGGGFANAPLRQAQLRMTSALRTKSQAIERYVSDGVISISDTKIIAIGAGRFGLYASERPFPMILSSVFPIGKEFFRVSRETGKITDQGFNSSFEIERHRGPVLRTAFIDEKFSHISGLIWSRVSIGEMSHESRPMSFVHNPLATSPMQISWGVWDQEFVATNRENSWEISDILTQNAT